MSNKKISSNDPFQIIDDHLQAALAEADNLDNSILAVKISEALDYLSLTRSR